LIAHQKAGIGLTMDVATVEKDKTVHVRRIIDCGASLAATSVELFSVLCMIQISRLLCVHREWKWLSVCDPV
jgi:hypothetical protein